MDPEFQTEQGSVAAAAAHALPAERLAFIRKTYLHVAGALAAFTLLEFAFFMTGMPETMLAGLAQLPYSWLVVMAAFLGVSWLASRFAESSSNRGLQYAGLAIYVLAESVIFMPLLLMASMIGGADLIGHAALLTSMLVIGLTVAVFTWQTDFSWLGPILCVGGFVALGLCVASAFMGFSLGLGFSAIMILFAAGAILYDTSNILHHYRTDQYVGAALALFASIALLFWYVLRLLMRLRD